MDDGKSHDSFKSNPEEEEEIKETKPKVALNQGQVHELMKALTAMKLTKEDNVPGQVFPELFIGSIGAAYNQKSLQELGITHILCTAAGVKPRFPTDFTYKMLPCLDSPNQNVLQFFDQATEFIKEAFKAN